MKLKIERLTQSWIGRTCHAAKETVVNSTGRIVRFSRKHPFFGACSLVGLPIVVIPSYAWMDGQISQMDSWVEPILRVGVNALLVPVFIAMLGLGGGLAWKAVDRLAIYRDDES